jgi:hypothetical protein
MFGNLKQVLLLNNCISQLEQKKITSFNFFKSATEYTEREYLGRFSDSLRAGLPVLDPRKGQNTSLFCITSSLKPTQPPDQWVRGGLSSVLMRQRRETDNTLPSSGEVKNSGGIPPLPIMPLRPSA